MAISAVIGVIAYRVSMLAALNLIREDAKEYNSTGGCFYVCVCVCLSLCVCVCV